VWSPLTGLMPDDDTHVTLVLPAQSVTSLAAPLSSALGSPTRGFAKPLSRSLTHILAAGLSAASPQTPLRTSTASEHLGNDRSIETIDPANQPAVEQEGAQPPRGVPPLTRQSDFVPFIRGPDCYGFEMPD
jgi:hypothetical protein